jgi:uncharacterized protein (DUF169 family)
MKSNNIQVVDGFLKALGYTEEPMGLYFSDEQPETGSSPEPMPMPTAEMEIRGEIAPEEVFKKHSCVLRHLLAARKKGIPAYFDKERFGCAGAAFYLGFTKPLLESVVHFISTGMPGMERSERYIDSPDAARRFYNMEMNPLPAPKRFCIFKPVSQFTGDDKPELVVFFAQPETISGLFCHVFFVTGDKEAVVSPAGSGCALLVTWPMKYLAEGKMKAVMGGWDPSCRPFLKNHEITFTVPSALFERMAARWEESFLTGPAWSMAQKRIRRNNKKG